VFMAENAVANFFTPTSQKPKDRLTWSERSPNDDSPPTLLVGRYDPAGSQEEELRFKRRKIAAFDLVREIDQRLLSPGTQRSSIADGLLSWYAAGFYIDRLCLG